MSMRLTQLNQQFTQLSQKKEQLSGMIVQGKQATDEAARTAADLTAQVAKYTSDVAPMEANYTSTKAQLDQVRAFGCRMLSMRPTSLVFIGLSCMGLSNPGWTNATGAGGAQPGDTAADPGVDAGCTGGRCYAERAGQDLPRRSGAPGYHRDAAKGVLNEPAIHSSPIAIFPYLYVDLYLSLYIS